MCRPIFLLVSKRCLRQVIVLTGLCFPLLINSQEQHAKKQSKSNFPFLLNGSDADLWWIFIQPAGLPAGRQCRVYVHDVRAIIET